MDDYGLIFPISPLNFATIKLDHPLNEAVHAKAFQANFLHYSCGGGGKDSQREGSEMPPERPPFASF